MAWKPILDMLDQREKTITDALDKARQAKEEAEALMVTNREMIGKARQEMAGIIEKAQRDAEQRRAEILARAHGEAEAKAKQFTEDLDRQKRAAIRDIRAEAVDLILAASSRLVSEKLDDEKHRGLVRDYIEDLSKTS